MLFGTMLVKKMFLYFSQKYEQEVVAIPFLLFISVENKNGQPIQIDQNSRWVVLTSLSLNFWVDVERLINL